MNSLLQTPDLGSTVLNRLREQEATQISLSWKHLLSRSEHGGCLLGLGCLASAQLDWGSLQREVLGSMKGLQGQLRSFL